MQTETSETDRRRPVWLALSELYLDNELQADDLERLANTLTQSSFSLAELRKIDLYEVFPLLQPNLLSVAGEWAGFEESWLFRNCERLYNLRNNTFHRFKCRFLNKGFYWMRKDDWTKIAEQVKP